MRRTITKYVILINLAMVLFFGLMRGFGLDQVTELRILNFVFVLTGLFMMMKELSDSGMANTYFERARMALIGGAWSIAVFSGLSIVYLELINPAFVAEVQNMMIWGRDLSSSQIVLGIFVEGMSSIIPMTYILMQYFKNYEVRASVVRRD